MAFATAVTPPSLFPVPTRPLSAISRRFPSPTFTGGGRCTSIVAKAVGDNSDTSDGSIVKSVQDAWSSSENLIGVAGLGFAAIVAVWASSNLVGAIDKLPVVPIVFEVIGLLFTWVSLQSLGLKLWLLETCLTISILPMFTVVHLSLPFV
ncbi:protein CURVATURE THYLAKOID 1C, chloroplastic-like isoform X1 [Zingiber officinale]|uniref:protein CURVATURE THYLAKOID 1C, chloroplastic-like isoform X1 n=1 Tax=Zingiber officinale TaxID=94328 RepID=UPI001C4CFA36|nr:protein CURVATURE THYLAKOID 1C, chloroplastic-like isoform X1 [Zingiber officinale]XP_042465788.1 protein CURVATURE THYLAKOID 1C, chloroplastic-like isoform X1 [Zingiber officinale]